MSRRVLLIGSGRSKGRDKNKKYKSIKEGKDLTLNLNLIALANLDEFLF
jgi:hypothetical protein